MTARYWIATGAVLGALAVAAGAFGAHALRARLSPADLATFETAARYQMYHALALLGVGLLAARGMPVASAGWSFVAGVALFSGSLYLLTLGGLRWMGAVTPLGGIALILGWLLLARAALAGQDG